MSSNIKKFIILLFIFLSLLIKIYRIKDNYSKNIFDKWIIIFTSNPPTQIIDYLVNTLIDWKILIIANETSIDNYWHKYKISNRLIYLSFKEQQKLRYNSIRYIYKTSYARKNIGYLFAIEHGAKEIYEIDDDIIIKNINKEIIFNNSKYSNRISIGINNNSKMINPYVYFGVKDIWPRGFVLNDIGYDNNIFFNYELKQIKLKPLIYQGLLNGEPDIDEIFFMTRKSKMVPLNISFLKNYPLLFIPGNYVPINSKNTKYLYDVFPSLPFFSSLNNKINDIFRGYIMQTYAWKYKGGIIFYNSNMYKYGNRNKSNIDFIKEKQLYFETKNFLKILKNTDKKENHPKEFLIKIIKSLVLKKILKKIDLKIYLSFLKDLSEFNYIYSNDYNENEITDINYLDIYTEFLYKYTIQGKIYLMNNKEIQLIKHRNSNKIYNNILLIIFYNYSKLIVLNRYMIKLYKKYFPHIVFLKEGYNNLTQENVIECKESFRGFYSYICFRSIYNKYPNMKGYLFLNDDNFFKPWEIENLDLNIPWMNFIRKHPNTSKPLSNYPKYASVWKRLNSTYNNINYFFNKNTRWKNNYAKCFGSSDILNILVDLIYFPKDIMSKFCDIVETMYDLRIFLQTAIPTALGILVLKRIQLLPSIFLWKKERKLIFKYLRNSYSFIGVHPIKFSKDLNKKLVNDYIEFMNCRAY